ncbi:hypothetical protein VDGL01_02417 [Verticillium dahliae]
MGGTRARVNWHQVKATDEVNATIHKYLRRIYLYLASCQDSAPFHASLPFGSCHTQGEIAGGGSEKVEKPEVDERPAQRPSQLLPSGMHGMRDAIPLTDHDINDDHRRTYRSGGKNIRLFKEQIRCLRTVRCWGEPGSNQRPLD